jgi:predicted component of type VI protein secretion system
MTPSHEESLRELLTRVHERLSKAATVDQDSRQLLGTLTRDIERALGSQPQPDAAEKRRVGRESVSRLEGLAAQFDADHPALAQTLRQLIDLLGKAGI